MPEENKNPLVLIVDDMQTLAEDTKEVIESFGFRTAIRNSATTAVAFVGNNEVDLILIDTDLQDSVLSGIDTAKLIQGRRDTPIIFISGYDDIETFRKADFNAPIYIMSKPYSSKQLKIQLQTAIYNREIVKRPPVINLEF